MVLHHRATVYRCDLGVEVKKRYIKKNGEWSAPKDIRYQFTPRSFPDPADRKITTLIGLGSRNRYYYGSDLSINSELAKIVVPLMVQTGRLCLVLPAGRDAGGPFTTFANTPCTIVARMAETSKDTWQLTGEIRFGDTLLSPEKVTYIWDGGLLFFDTTVAFLENRQEHVGPLLQLLSGHTITIPSRSVPAFLEDFYALGNGLPIELPPAIAATETHVSPVPCLRLLKPDPRESIPQLIAEVVFDYNDTMVSLESNVPTIYDAEHNIVTPVDRQFHKAALDMLKENGVLFAQSYLRGITIAKIPRKKYLDIVALLVEKGWRVEGEQGIFRKPGSFSLSVSSGIDWFDLSVSCSYDDVDIPLPKILRALEKGEGFVALDDGSTGLLPQEWLARFGSFARMGKLQDDSSIRFKRSQTLLVDMLLDEKEGTITCDGTFAKIREQLRSFEGITPLDAHTSFRGTLRPYQREGMGWLSFLEEFGLGGCLADDMGLGKTVQVLAHLHRRNVTRKRSKKKGHHTPSLVVAPRSLIFNWMEEAKRFTPTLTVHDFSGTGRSAPLPDPETVDLILVTYGTLRRDIERLRTLMFDYVILDEAQVIKNAATLTAKTTRLLEARNRLALSGTPVENHIGDLWSIFEFLNPGMLGTSKVFSAIRKNSAPDDDSSLELLRRVLRPFILRRTKSQVATDLPPRTEEIIHCEMKPAQRKIYEQLKQYYRTNLLKKVEENGLKRSKILILEALLRLRQAACHPELVEKRRGNFQSVKLDTLLSQIRELRDEGSKCIVFSQFTTMLSIVRASLDKEGIVCEYLDGRTRDRRRCVDTFQNDPQCGVFLISLKAGGVGLNLTAAEYVFIFDPWWNPAVEAQAIDRTHRIGQNKPVFAYKLICKDTVEEKVLELQQKKRAVADAVISSDESLLRSITGKDLEVLLS